MRNAGLEEAQAGVKIAGRNINNLRFEDATILMEESEESLDESERGEWKSWLKTQHSKNEDHGIQFHHFMASSSITSWQIDGETKVTVTDFILLGSKITADDDCSHEIKRHMILGRKDDHPRQHIKKQRYHFTDIGPYSQIYGFSSSHVWMWDWTIKKSEHRRTDAFELQCWRRLLRSPWTARRSNQSILKEISPEYSLEGLILGL